jgi:hypothetical protein
MCVFKTRVNHGDGITGAGIEILFVKVLILPNVMKERLIHSRGSGSEKLQISIQITAHLLLNFPGFVRRLGGEISIRRGVNDRAC